ncbi:MAG: hypothetical protein AB7V46_16375 [Thermomicrobiales bacterium]
MRASEAAVIQLARTKDLQESLRVALGKSRAQVGLRRFRVTLDESKTTASAAEKFAVIVEAVDKDAAILRVAGERRLNPYHLAAARLRPQSATPLRENSATYAVYDQSRLNRFTLLLQDKLHLTPTVTQDDRGVYLVSVTGEFGDHDIASLAAAAGGQVFRVDNQPK